MYAVDLFLDAESSEYIKSIWTELTEKNVGSGLDKQELLEPHITLAVYDEINDKEEFIKKLSAFEGSLKKIKTRFDILGSFPTTGTCLIAPMITEEILSMHRRYYEVMKEYNYSAREYYMPERWNPHCTIATKLKPEELKEVFRCALDVFEPFEGAFYGIGFYELKIDEKGVIIGSERLM